MTTIACDGKSMAGDGQSEASGSVLTMKQQKVCRLKDGSLFGSSGKAADRIAVTRWLNDEGPKPKPKMLAALRLMPDGSLLYMQEALEPTPVDVPCAVGSGMDFALGAMDAGVASTAAVEIAAKRDPGTGGQITTLFLEQADG
jgi:ATP-dependent protease HslVU (ClpYQ) peptidase subunit